MAERVGQGGTIRLDARYVDGTGALTNPTTPRISIIDANSVTQVSNATPTQDGTGLFHYDYTVPALGVLGLWTARWTGTINSVNVTGDDFFEVVTAGSLQFSQPGQYTARATLKGELKIADAADDTRLDRVIEAVSRSIDRFVGFPRRHFWQTASGTARHYTPRTAKRLWIHDLVSVETVSIDTSGDGTYETSWTNGVEYVLDPFDANSQSEPYTSLVIKSDRGDVFPVGVEKSVKVTGTWGWPAVPDEVEEACLIQCARIHKRADAPFGIAPIPAVDTGSAVRLLARLDPDVELMLKPLRRTRLA